MTALAAAPDIDDLVRLFEESESATQTARAASERDRRYYDGRQLTDDEEKALARRGQPPVVINRIKRKIDFLRGYEESQRVKPVALPRTPQHEHDADGATQAMVFVAEDQNYNQTRSAMWDNILVEGAGGCEVTVRMGRRYPEVVIKRVAWNRMFWDPYSAAPDFSDATYLGTVQWLDMPEATRIYPDAVDALEWTMAQGTAGDTYDDKPKYQQWCDKKRQRIRICQIWRKIGDKWDFAEFTKGGVLKHGPSPYVDDQGDSECPLVFVSAFVGGDENDRYGVVREMISPQDEINKRRSKALHILNTAQIIVEEGAVRDSEIEALRREAAKPDGVIRLAPGASDKFKIERQTELATAQFQLLQEAKGEIDAMAGNLALVGDGAAKGASGKAIIASQQGGQMEIAPVLDALRFGDMRVFRLVWARIRQFWTAERWVRVTDDERNLKWVVINPQNIEALKLMANTNPDYASKIAGVVRNVAELDCDITIDSKPDGLTPQLEQFQALVELKKMDANGELPFRALVEAMPNLRNRDRVIAAMEQRTVNPAAEQAQATAMQMQMAQAEADIRNTHAGAAQKEASAEKTRIEAGRAAVEPIAPAPMAEAGPPPG